MFIIKFMIKKMLQVPCNTIIDEIAPLIKYFVKSYRTQKISVSKKSQLSEKRDNKVFYNFSIINIDGDIETCVEIKNILKNYENKNIKCSYHDFLYRNYQINVAIWTDKLQYVNVDDDDEYYIYDYILGLCQNQCIASYDCSYDKKIFKIYDLLNKRFINNLSYIILDYICFMNVVI